MDRNYLINNFFNIARYFCYLNTGLNDVALFKQNCEILYSDDLFEFSFWNQKILGKQPTISELEKINIKDLESFLLQFRKKEQIKSLDNTTLKLLKGILKEIKPAYSDEQIDNIMYQYL